MTKLTEINRATLQMLSQKMVEACQQIAADHGITIASAGGQWGLTEGTVKMKVTVTDDGALEAKARREWDVYCYRHALEPSDFGAVFESGGRSFRVCGIAPKSAKRPILAADLGNDRIYAFPSQVTREAIIAARKAK